MVWLESSGRVEDEVCVCATNWPPTPYSPSVPAEMIWYVCGFWYVIVPLDVWAVSVPVYGFGDGDVAIAGMVVAPASGKFTANWSSMGWPFALFGSVSKMFTS